ncbi:OLC1v1032333C1 [Oldenlandia corymbosa var. corymbosa]|uniref:OLC1v1032333C1 n=1 Tax=Oldenlandia corymbosa var. corymbosa TaxID=529605 RepID=A0AAV1CKU0_OLDCO|nr:OLC1v1032333C1 [Oldenlandia corymbosa var. corymbosa]
MGKKLDALLGRRNKGRKIKPTINLGISRLCVLKNQREARLNIARSDVLQLLNLGQHERALLRVEQVIKEQNMLDAYVMIESYLHQLIERINLIDGQKTCPEELTEAASSLIYAATRCGDFPELQEIRTFLTSCFGKEFAARAAELRNNCGVNYKMIQKLSTRMPNLDSRMKVLKGIASENSIILELEDVELERTEEPRRTDSGLDQPTQRTPSHSIDAERLEEFTESVRLRTEYKDVAAAAQAAFESAAYAAAAARAAVQLSRSDSQDPHNPKGPKLQPAVYSPNDAAKSNSQSDLRDFEEHNARTRSEKIQSKEKDASKFEGMVKAEQFKGGKDEGNLRGPYPVPAQNHLKTLDDEAHGMRSVSLRINRNFDGETTQRLQHRRDVLDSKTPDPLEGTASEESYRKSYSPSHEQVASGPPARFKMEQVPKKLTTGVVGDLKVEKRPISVRTRRTYGR